MTQPQAEFLDLYRAGLKTAADLMKASLQNAEKLQNQQLVAIRTALDQQTKTINELGQARSVDELLALQTRMAGAQWERAMGYWSELCQTQMAQARDWLSEAAHAATANAIVRQQAAKQQRRAAWGEPQARKTQAHAHALVVAAGPVHPVAPRACVNAGAVQHFGHAVSHRLAAQRLELEVAVQAERERAAAARGHNAPHLLQLRLGLERAHVAPARISRHLRSSRSRVSTMRPPRSPGAGSRLVRKRCGARYRSRACAGIREAAEVRIRHEPEIGVRARFSRKNLDPVAVADDALQRRRLAVHRHRADLGVRHAERLDRVLQRRRAGAGVLERMAALLLLEESRSSPEKEKLAVLTAARRWSAASSS